MASVYLLVPLSLILLGAAVWAFFWAVNSGQFEDLDDPAHRVLEDDLPPALPTPKTPREGPQGLPQPRTSRSDG